MTFAQVRAQAVEDAVAFAWAHVQRLAVSHPDELAPHLCGLAEVHEKLGEVLNAARAAHYTAMAAELKERENEACTDAAD